MKRVCKKQAYKKLHKKCFFCEEDNYALLNLHRIIPGSEGGKYIASNTLCVCANCHNRIHLSKEIVIDRKYLQMAPGFVVHFFQNGIEYWKQEKIG